MKKQQFIFMLTLISLGACSKSANSGKPKISISSITTTIPVGAEMVAELDFTEGDGDLSEGTFIAIRNRLNRRPLPPGTAGTDSITVRLPIFPSNKGKLEFRLPYTFLRQSDVEVDTILFKFAVIDKAGNKSDTIATEKLFVLK